jgi:hypothetical protein
MLCQVERAWGRAGQRSVALKLRPLSHPSTPSYAKAARRHFLRAHSARQWTRTANAQFASGTGFRPPQPTAVSELRDNTPFSPAASSPVHIRPWDPVTKLQGGQGRSRGRTSKKMIKEGIGAEGPMSLEPVSPHIFLKVQPLDQHYYA